MDGNPIQSTSFIPKKPITARGDFSGSLGGIFIAISIIIFIVSIAGYFYASYQEKSKNQEVTFLKDTLEKAQRQFEPNQVINMVRFDMKMKIAKDLLYLDRNIGFDDSIMHITLRPLFKLLSDKTLQSVRFKDFKYTNIDNQKIDIRVSGEAKGSINIANYAAVAQQAREFSDTRLLMNVIVSDLNLGVNNNVIFNLSASVKPELLSYTEAIKQQ